VSFNMIGLATALELAFCWPGLASAEILMVIHTLQSVTIASKKNE